MCNLVILDLYHTCMAGNEKDILSGVPYKAEVNNEQWLGKGYYFWVESLKFAHDWGRKYKDGYCIVRFNLEIKRNDLLDLVGSPNDMTYLKELIKDAKILLGEDGKDLTVAAYINHLQSIDAWQWLATKLADVGKMNQIKAHSSKISNSGELIFLNSRIQLCLHTEPDDDKIKLKLHKIVHNRNIKSELYKNINYRILK